ncbi:MAG: hypothetical protein ACYDEC_14315 [Bacteroidia bacterium]
MKKKDNKTNSIPPQTEKENNNNTGYPLYPTKEDIYSKWKEEKDLDPGNPSIKKLVNETVKAGEQNEKNFSEDMVGGDLDILGSEADDDYKNVGNEDEENNYYSLGGDGHNNLEEDNG